MVCFCVPLACCCCFQPVCLSKTCYLGFIFLLFLLTDTTTNLPWDDALYCQEHIQFGNVVCCAIFR